MFLAHFGVLLNETLRSLEMNSGNHVDPPIRKLLRCADGAAIVESTISILQQLNHWLQGFHVLADRFQVIEFIILCIILCIILNIALGRCCILLRCTMLVFRLVLLASI